MAHTADLFKRGWGILTEEGPKALLSRSLAFLKYVIESEYHGRTVKRNAPFEYRGVTLPLDWDVFDNRIRHAFATNSYEAAEAELIDEYVAGSYDVVDLGASTGFSTVYALKGLGGQSNGVAVEANPEMIDVIDAVQDLNDINFDVEHAAYRPGQSEVTFHVHSKTVSSSTKRSGGREITVPAVSMAEILAGNDVEEFVCLADIEGGEIDLVRNELGLLEDRCKLIIVELHEIDGIAAEAKRRFDESGFLLEDVIGDVYVYRNESL